MARPSRSVFAARDARRHNLKRGRGVQHVPLDETAVVSDDRRLYMRRPR